MYTGCKFRKPDTNKTLGIEIECLVPRDTLNLFEGTYKGFFYATDDASISSDYWGKKGIEFVSMPLPSTWLKKEIARLEKLTEWETNDSCGIHIHVSRKWLSEKRARLIHEFYRTLSTDDQLEFFGRRYNSYCRISEWGSVRYCAVNSQNEATFEFRMFASGDVKWAQRCVDTAVYMINNASTLNVHAFQAFVDQYK